MKKFDTGRKTNKDIALILLKDDGVNISDFVMPICLPNKTTEYVTDLNFKF